LAQEAVRLKVGSPYSSAVEELRRGRKTSHWIWYVFPQLLDPGRSSANNTKFQIRTKQEARAYLAHALLRKRYLECVGLVTQHVHEAHGRGEEFALASVLGSAVDAKKFYHSISTFALAALHDPSGDMESLELLSRALLVIISDAAENAKVMQLMDIGPEAASFVREYGKPEVPPLDVVVVQCANKMIFCAWSDLPVS
jgi:uncharacterized protein (DUF1810 family)